MHTVGIVCEYNPFHLGHLHQIRSVRQFLGEGTAVVCLMSGNYVQRGAPAVFDKSIRAKAAVLCGVNMVLELPVPAALSSAEGFAYEGVRLLSLCCDTLSFGTESLDTHSLQNISETLLSARYTSELKQVLSSGCSFPAARQAALEKLGCAGEALRLPNNILGIEYTKAIMQQHSSLMLLPIQRTGAYHAAELSQEAPSASAIRRAIENNAAWECAVPAQARQLFRQSVPHTLSAGERAVLSRLWTMTDAEFEALPFGSEGLWRKLMKESRRCCSLEEIASSVKSKRYTRSRINRMILCAFLGITREMMEQPAPYVRVLAFDEIGQSILKEHRDALPYCNAGQAVPSPMWESEKKWGSLYSLFSCGAPEPPTSEEKRRVFVSRKADT